MLQTIRAEKVDQKNVVICLVPMFPFWVKVRKLAKKVHFLQFCANLSKKSKSANAIYIYASESSHYTLSEKSHRLEILAIKISKKILNQQKFNKILQFQMLISLKQ